MATFTSKASGAWDATGLTTWNEANSPTVGDTVTIGAHTITIPVGVSIEVGDGTTVIAVSLAHASAKLIVNGNLSVVGNLQQTTAGSKVEFRVISSDIAFILKNSATLRSKWIVAGLNTCEMTIVGNAIYRVNISTDITAGQAEGYIESGGFNPIINWQFFKLTSVGGATRDCCLFTANTNTILADGVFKSCGQLNIGGAGATGVFSMTRVLFITWMAASCISYTNTTTKTGGLRLVSHCGFYHTEASHATYYTSFTARDMTILNSVFSGCHARHAANTTLNNTYTNCLWPGNDSGSGSRRVGLWSKSNTIIDNCAFISYCTDSADGNPHYVDESSGDCAGLLNITKNCVIDGSNRGGTGDFLLNRAEHKLEKNIFIARCGNISDGLYGGTNQVRVIQCTCVNTNLQPGYGSIVISESAASADKILEARSNIFYDVPSGVCMGAITWTEQANFLLDYNCFYALRGAGVAGNENYVHPTLGRSYLIKSVSSRVTGTVSGAPVGNDVTLSDATGVIVGDLYKNSGTIYAVIIAVVGSVVTLGQRFEAAPGTLGIAGIVNAQAYTIYKNYWTSGTYGEAGKGLNDISVDPEFRDLTRTGLTWDTLNGGAGTMASIIAQTIKITGFDTAGAPAVFNTNYTVENYLAYIRYGFTPENAALLNSGYLGEDIGALESEPIVSSVAAYNKLNLNVGISI